MFGFNQLISIKQIFKLLAITKIFYHIIATEKLKNVEIISNSVRVHTSRIYIITYISISFSSIFY